MMVRCTSGNNSIENIEAEPLDLIRAYRKGFNKIS